MAIQYLNGEEAKKLLGSEKMILSIFATWCGPCQMMAPQLEELSEKVSVVKVDVDKNKEFAKEMGVSSLPTTFIIKNGEIAETLIGFVPKDQIEEKL